MDATRRTKRYVVGDLGFGFAVFDTQQRIPQEQVIEGATLPDSSNPKNSRIVEVFPTKAQAVAHALELNRREGPAG